MDFITATRKAIKKNIAMTRKSWEKFNGGYVLPTNTCDCFLLGQTDERLKSPENPRMYEDSNALIRWNPKTEDVLADDWVLWK